MPQGSSAHRTDRFFELDALRGLLIILMALDHANHFIGHTHPTLEMWGGPFPVYSSSSAFLTRFVTHLAAPGFSFVLGIGMMLFAASRLKRGWTKLEIRGRLWLRGGFLILLQVLVINRAWEMYPDPFPRIYFGVLMGLGGALIVGAFMLWLPRGILVSIAIGTLLLMEAIHPAPVQWGSLNPGWIELLLLQPGGDMNVWSNYPIFAWLEFALLGMVYGSWMNSDREKALRYAIPIGAAFILIFLPLRWLNGFGNIRPMAEATWIGFLNLVKYPPSLTFFLFTAGANLFLLGSLSRLKPGYRGYLKPLVVFGRVPLFFYILHLFLYAFLGLALTPEGASPPFMFALWIMGLLIAYPVCIWFDRLKSKQGEGSLLRLL